MSNDDNERTTHRRPINPDGPGGSQQRGGGSHDTGATRMTTIRTPNRPPEQGSPQNQTIIHSGGSPGEPNPNQTMIHRPQAAGLTGKAAETYQPVTGWLVAVAGPGKGKSRSIFEGMNPVGRDPGQRIPLDFDDGEISREKHFFITYEPKKRTFHISIGEKANLVYLNGEVVLSPMVLTEGAEIEVGKTKLRFVPLCGPGFSWDED